jgi:hypothetical protein
MFGEKKKEYAVFSRRPYVSLYGYMSAFICMDTCAGMYGQTACVKANAFQAIFPYSSEKEKKPHTHREQQYEP